MILLTIRCPFSPQKSEFDLIYSNISIMLANGIRCETKFYYPATNKEIILNENQDDIIALTKNCSSVDILAKYKKTAILLEFKETANNLTLLKVSPYGIERRLHKANTLDLGWYVDFAITLTYGYMILSLETILLHK